VHDPAIMARFHFVEDYERHVAGLLATYPVDEAMSLAVGGDYVHFGAIECAVLRHAGLADGMTLIDLGCGSGRLAAVLGARMRVFYIGIDIVQSLLDYAATKAPPDYRFILHRELNIPAPDQSADMLAAFSVFTHLLPAETYLYLKDAARVLRPGGRLVFSFLEFAEPAHWAVFESTIDGQRRSASPHLNQFVERGTIALWAEKLGYAVEGFIDAHAAAWPDAPPLGQSIAILRFPAG